MSHGGQDNGPDRGVELVRRNLTRQRAYYGEVLGDRVRRLMNCYGISQTQLATTIGISPAMLSQVMSGRRAKLANPAVLARMVLLERRARGHMSSASGAQERAAVLHEVGQAADSEAVRAASRLDREHLVAALRDCLSPTELAGAALVVAGVSPTLAELLTAAAPATPTDPPARLV
ncbi:MAG: helix-turn-helix domain-containing protein [Actinomycetota bacterium]|nr:helix-turn-helix domain-containing protein [Actinomycetota bacterium]